MIVTEKSQLDVSKLNPRERARWYDCERKVAYPAQGVAAQAAQFFMNSGDGGSGVIQMAAYRCHWCGDWHITRKVEGDSRDGYLVIPYDAVGTRNTIRTARALKTMKQHVKRHSDPGKNRPAKRKGGRYFDE